MYRDLCVSCGISFFFFTLLSLVFLLFSASFFFFFSFSHTYASERDYCWNSRERREKKKKRRWKRESRSPFVRYHHCRSFFLSCVDNFTQFFLSVCVCLSLSVSRFWQPLYVSHRKCSNDFFRRILNQKFVLKKKYQTKPNTRYSSVHMCLYLCKRVFTNVHACRVIVAERVIVHY